MLHHHYVTRTDEHSCEVVAHILHANRGYYDNNVCP